MKKKKIWVTWESQRRNRELSSAFGAKLFELCEIDRIKSRIIKYGLGIFKTSLILLRERPKVIFCQNPSLVLSAFLVVLGRLSRIEVCVDCHNAGLFPLEGRSKVLLFVSKFIQRHAKLVIVSNPDLKERVKRNGGKYYVLPDKVPSLANTKPRKLKGKWNLLFICSFADDEPYQTVFEAAKKLPRDIVIYVTGDYRGKIDSTPGGATENLVFTGYLPEPDYVILLRSVDAVIDLTEREDCLVCGGYEALSAEKPLVLSNRKALREYFSQGAIYTEHNPASISKAICEVIENKEDLTEKVRILKAAKQAEWAKRKKDLLAAVDL